jgi:hypothetical protein
LIDTFDEVSHKFQILEFKYFVDMRSLLMILVEVDECGNCSDQAIYIDGWP